VAIFRVRLFLGRLVGVFGSFGWHPTHPPPTFFFDMFSPLLVTSGEPFLFLGWGSLLLEHLGSSKPGEGRGTQQRRQCQGTFSVAASAVEPFRSHWSFSGTPPPSYFVRVFFSSPARCWAPASRLISSRMKSVTRDFSSFVFRSKFVSMSVLFFSVEVFSLVKSSVKGKAPGPVEGTHPTSFFPCLLPPFVLLEGGFAGLTRPPRLRSNHF